MAVHGHAGVGLVRTARCRMRNRRRRLPGVGSADDAPCLGYVFYAPPRAVPRAGLFPTGPVSADAVLLTSLGVEPGADVDGIAARSDDGGRRGSGPTWRSGARGVRANGGGCRAVRAARSRRATAGRRGARRLLGRAVRHRRGLPHRRRVQVVAPHRYFPRLRLELEQGLGWKADVEAALERLLESARLQQPVGAGACRPACESGQPCAARPVSTVRSCASSSANVNVPVGRSFLPSR